MNIKNQIELLLEESNIAILKDIREEGQDLYVILEPKASYKQNIDKFKDLEKSILNLTGAKVIYTEEKITATKEEKNNNSKKKQIKNVKHIIGVGSGKGGVGKSTISVALAASFKLAGYNVAIVDADMYGPSLPQMLGVKELPEIIDDMIQPIIVDGIQTMSIGYIVDEEKALIWRGPMITKMLHQIMHMAAWDNIDVMIVDMPPGTGDVQLSLMENYCLDGMVIVSTPQKVAFNDALKAAKMCDKLGVPVMGFVENMASNDKFNIFGEGVVEKMCVYNNYKHISKVEINPIIAEYCDNGTILKHFLRKNLDFFSFLSSVDKIRLTMGFEGKI